MFALALALLFPFVSLFAHAGLHDLEHQDVAADLLKCDQGKRSDEGKGFCEHREQRRAAEHGTLTVDCDRNGGVLVHGWDRDSLWVRVKIETRAGSEDEARQLASEIRVVWNGSTIHAAGPEKRPGESWSANFVIYAPRRHDLDLTAENGPVAVEDMSGVMDLRVQNGPLVLSSVAGQVHARAENGPLVVALDGSHWNGRSLDAETVNGPVVLTLPEDYSANFETGTVNGPRDVDLPLTVRVGGEPRFTTVLGHGGASVRVVTTNGPLIIHRK